MKRRPDPRRDPSERPAAPPVGESEERTYRLDALVEGQEVRRGVSVRVAERTLVVDGRRLPLAEMYWVARRSGLLLLFGRRYTLALQGKSAELEELARVVERRAEMSERRRQLLRPFTSEVIVCTAGAAVSGTLEGEPMQGLHVAIFTQRGLHLVGSHGHRVVSWPVERARSSRSEQGAGTGEILLLRHGGTFLRLKYLFPEEIRAVLRVAEKEPSSGGGTDGRPLELFVRGEVAPPIPPALPPFGLTLQEMQRDCRDVAARLPESQLSSASLSRRFFETHFLELGEVALGPLMLRRSAAAGTASLRKAQELLDARSLREDAAAAAAAAAERLVETFAREVDRVATGRRLRGDREETPPLTAEDRRIVDRRMCVPVERLADYFTRLQATQETLLHHLDDYEAGPPDGPVELLEAAAEEWRAALGRLDRGFGTVWQEMLEEAAEIWRERFLPRLAGAGGPARRRLSERARALWVWAIVLVLAIGVMVIVLR